MKQHLNFEALKNNLIDMITESQLKLGYAKEPVSLYYPLESLNGLMDTELNAENMLSALQEFALSAENTLGKLTVSRNNTRFCIKIPEEGVEYVHTHTENTDFLKAFIEKIQQHHLDIDAVLQVFRRYSDHVHWEKTGGDEFDYMIYFENGKPDDFRYCIKFEGSHAIYHRFTPKDYEAFHF